MKVYFLLAMCVILPVISQLVMKKGMNIVGEFNSDNIFDLSFLVNTFSNFHVLLGVFLYAINSVFWLMVVSKLPVSKAYPAVSLSYVIIIIAAYFVIGEPLTIKKVLGSLTIVAGVFIIFMK